MDWLTCTSENGVELEIGCDIVIAFDHESTVELAEYPVEKGYEPTDHTIVKADTLSVQITQSRTPLDEYEQASQKTIETRDSVFEPSGLLALTTAIGNAIGSLFGSTGKQPLKLWTYDLKDKDYPNELEAALITSMNLGHDCVVTIKGKAYNRLRMVKVHRGYAATKDGADSFTVDFKGFRVLETKTTSLPSPAQLKPKAVKGKTSASTTGKEEQKKVEAGILKRGSDAVKTRLGV